MTTAPLTEQTPAEIDTQLFPLWAQRWQLAAQIHYYEGILAKLPVPSGESTRYKENLARFHARYAEVLAEILPFEDEYNRRGGWARYYLVANTNGHLHLTQDCPTCYSTTQFLLVAESSGLEADALIERFAEVVCTVCFPDAPSTPAYARGIEKARISAAEKAAQQCAGTGQYVSGSYGHRYASCPAGCGATVSVTQSGKARAHKTPEQEDAIVAANPKLLQRALQFKTALHYGGSTVTTVAAAKEVLREAIQIKLIAGTSADYNSYYAGRLDAACDAENRARYALQAKGLTTDEVAKIVTNAEKKTRKEYGL